MRVLLDTTYALRSPASGPVVTDQYERPLIAVSQAYGHGRLPASALEPESLAVA
jgi:hypothetical protein